MLIHMGYPKTASTYLQTRFLNNAEAGLMTCGEWWEIYRRLNRPNPLWYDRQAVQDHLEPLIADAKTRGLTPVITHELLVGHPAGGGYEAAEVGRRIRDLWPEATLLIVIREQRSILYSIYAEYVRNGGPLSLEEYLEPAGGDRQPVFDFRYLEFDRLIGFLRGLFGAERVHAMPFELFAGDPLAFCNSILALVGRPPLKSVPTEVVRAALTAPSIPLRQFLNRWFLRDRNNHHAPFSFPFLARLGDQLDRRWPAGVIRRHQAILAGRIERFVGDRYAASNRRTSRQIGLDLAAFGYPCAESGDPE